MKFFKTLAFVTAVFATTFAFAAEKSKTILPEGMSYYAAFMATGELDPSQMVIDGDGFFTDIMGYNEQQIAAEREAARVFFIERFGIDVDDPSLVGRIAFGSFQLNPAVDYRAYTIAGYRIGDQGAEVRDGGFRVDVLDPNGVALGGQFAGRTIYPGTFLLHGTYNVLIKSKVKPNGKVKEQTVSYRYRSQVPTGFSANGTLAVQCEIVKDGKVGLVQGLMAPFPVDGGKVNVNMRTVSTIFDAE